MADGQLTCVQVFAVTASNPFGICDLMMRRRRMEEREAEEKEEQEEEKELEREEKACRWIS